MMRMGWGGKSPLSHLVGKERGGPRRGVRLADAEDTVAVVSRQLAVYCGVKRCLTPGYVLSNRPMITNQ